MKNLKISTKLFISFSIIIVLATAMSLFGSIGLIRIQETQRAAITDNEQALQAIGNIRANFQEQRVLIREFLLFDMESDESIEASRQLEEANLAMESYIAAYVALQKSDREKAAFSDFLAVYRGEYNDLKVSVEAVDVKIKSKIASIVSQSHRLAEQCDAVLDICLEEVVANGESAITSNQNTVNTTTYIQLTLMFLCIAAAAFLGFDLNYRIAKPLKGLLKAAKEMEKGNVDVKIDYESRDEVGQFAQAFKGMCDMIHTQMTELNYIADGELSRNIQSYGDGDMIGGALQKCSNSWNHILSEVNTSANQVYLGAEQLSEGSQLLAQGASEQATAIEQLSSSIYEISLNTKENAKMADALAEIYKGINQRAHDGSDLMNEVLDSIQSIQQATTDISKIMKLMRDISFQTNILSINAAVEAANAGEQGKGFAVVADEVRNLAKKSSQAAADTEELIETCITKVQEGSTITKKAHDALVAIMSDIVQSSKHIDDIAVSTNEQSTSVEQINVGIDQVSKVINTNNSSAEQSAMAAEEMSAMAGGVAKLISNIKLRDTENTSKQVHFFEKKPQKKPVILFEDERDNEKY